MRTCREGMRMMQNECPYGASECPKIRELDERIDILERNQAKLMRLLYYIAGIVSVSLGVTIYV